MYPETLAVFIHWFLLYLHGIRLFSCIFCFNVYYFIFKTYLTQIIWFSAINGIILQTYTAGSIMEKKSNQVIPRDLKPPNTSWKQPPSEVQNLHSVFTSIDLKYVVLQTILTMSSFRQSVSEKESKIDTKTNSILFYYSFVPNIHRFFFFLVSF